MESRSKIRVADAQIAELCDRYLNSSCLSHGELSDGWFNTIHKISLEDGRDVVLKISPPPSFACMRYEKNLIESEVAVLRLLFARSIRVPRVLAFSPEGDIFGHAWFVMDCLKGDNLGKLRGQMDETAVRELDVFMATELARVNGIVGQNFGRFHADHTASKSWFDSFRAMMVDVLLDAGDAGVALPLAPDSVLAMVDSARNSLDEVSAPRLVLWDLHDGNVMVDPGVSEVQGIIDCDRSVWGDPLLEYYFRYQANKPDFWKAAYRSTYAGELNPLDRPGASVCLALYELYLALVMVVEVAFRGFSEGHDQWVRSYFAEALGHCRAAGL